MSRQDTNTTDSPASDELEKKRKEFQNEIAHNKKPAAVSRPSRKRLIVGLCLAIALLAGLAGAAVYSLVKNNPDKVVADAVFRALKSNTVTFTGTVKSGQTIDAPFSGASAGTKGAKFTFDATLKFDSKAHKIGTDMILDRDGNVYLGAGGIQSALGSDLVADAVNTGTYSNELAKKLDGKWLKISSDQLQPYSRKVAAVQSCIETVIKKNQSDEPLLGNVAEIYKQHVFMKVTGTLGTDNGSTGYTVQIDSDKLKAFLTEFKKTPLYTQLHDCDSATFELNPEKFVKNLAGSSLRAQKIELWINNQRDITKIVVDGSAEGLRGFVTISPQFNQEVKVVVPPNLVTLNELREYMNEGNEALSLSKESDPASQKKLQQLIEKLKTEQK